MTPEQRETIALHRRIGEAEGLLIGWLYVDHKDAAHLELARSVTQRFIDARKEQDHANG
ncbi:MAG: hypothetical protein IPO08_19750 [Xanthomonadales bacterium]|nr:hypothetical protein [Xanthomonadales bacterium]